MCQTSAMRPALAAGGAAASGHAGLPCSLDWEPVPGRVVPTRGGGFRGEPGRAPTAGFNRRPPRRHGGVMPTTAPARPPRSSPTEPANRHGRPCSGRRVAPAGPLDGSVRCTASRGLVSTPESARLTDRRARQSHRAPRRPTPPLAARRARESGEKEKMTKRTYRPQRVFPAMPRKSRPPPANHTVVSTLTDPDSTLVLSWADLL